MEVEADEDASRGDPGKLADELEAAFDGVARAARRGDLGEVIGLIAAIEAADLPDRIANGNRLAALFADRGCSDWLADHIDRLRTQERVRRWRRRKAAARAA